MQLFGFNIGKKKPVEINQPVSFATPVDEDGASTISSEGGHYGSFLDFNGAAKSESELISKYRDIAMYSDCDSAIEEICAEAISAEDDEEVVKINLENVKLSEKIKNLINEEFEEIQHLLSFDSRAHDIFRRWYVDGRVYYHKIYDPKRPNDGLVEIRYIDPRKIKKVRELTKKKDDKNGVDIVTKVEEYFVYSDKGLVSQNSYTNASTSTQAVKIAPEAIAYCTSGLIDLDANLVLGHLHKAVKPTNMLRIAEDSLLIYRLSRAPEKKVFYVDVGNLPKQKADQYLKEIMSKHRNKIVYDASTGEVKDDRKHMSMMEDYWLPRRGGGTGTEIRTLEGAANLGVVDDITYYQTKLYQALNVPVSRLQSSSPLNFGRQTEITRDELKFAKFINRLRRKFTELFDDLLGTQLVLKGIMSDEEWKQLKYDIKYVFASDIYWAEAKEIENTKNRIETLSALDPFVGIYFSKAYIKKNILKQTEEEIEEIQAEIDEEKPDMLQHAQFQGQITQLQQGPPQEGQG